MKSWAAAARAASAICSGVAPGRRIGDVGGDGVVEQEGLLGDQGDAGAQVAQAEVAQVARR